MTDAMTSRISRALILVAVLTGTLGTLGMTGMAAARAANAQSAAPDMTGDWTFTVQNPNGTGMPSATFKQEGEKLTGHYSSQALGQIDFTGTVKGKEFTFTLNTAEFGAISYKGTIESADSLKGTLTIAQGGEGTFTAERRKSN